MTRSYCFPPSLLAHCFAFWHLYWWQRQDVSRHNSDSAETVDYLYLKSCFMLLYGPRLLQRGLPSITPHQRLSHSLIFSTMIKRTMSHIISSSESLSLQAFMRFNTSDGAWRNRRSRLVFYSTWMAFVWWACFFVHVRQPAASPWRNLQSACPELWKMGFTWCKIFMQEGQHYRYDPVTPFHYSRSWGICNQHFVTPLGSVVMLPFKRSGESNALTMRPDKNIHHQSKVWTLLESFENNSRDKQY